LELVNDSIWDGALVTVLPERLKAINGGLTTPKPRRRSERARQISRMQPSKGENDLVLAPCLAYFSASQTG
jgi:hypothetical protein